MVFNLCGRISQRVIVASIFRNAQRFRNTSLLTGHPSRSLVYNETGGILDRPEQNRFGLLKALLVVTVFTCLGGTLSKTGAAFLEENEIFIPGDDDDD